MNESLEIISKKIKKLVFIGSIAVTLCAVPPAEAQQTTKPLNWCGTPARSTIIYCPPVRWQPPVIICRPYPVRPIVKPTFPRPVDPITRPVDPIIRQQPFRRLSTRSRR